MHGLMVHTSNVSPRRRQDCFLEETSVDDDCAITELCNGGGSKYSGYSSVILVAAAAALLVAVVDMVF